MFSLKHVKKHTMGWICVDLMHLFMTYLMGQLIMSQNILYIYCSFPKLKTQAAQDGLRSLVLKTFSSKPLETQSLFNFLIYTMQCYNDSVQEFKYLLEIVVSFEGQIAMLSAIFYVLVLFLWAVS